uniref:Enkurin domain-containing protein n=1 Tax=Macrostomum lignano TaxID=282301 RepID=A0A1I8FLK6_9PLAT
MICDSRVRGRGATQTGCLFLRTEPNVLKKDLRPSSALLHLREGYFPEYKQRKVHDAKDHTGLNGHDCGRAKKRLDGGKRESEGSVHVILSATASTTSRPCSAGPAKNKTYRGRKDFQQTTERLPNMNYFSDPEYMDRLIDPLRVETLRQKEALLEAERHSHKTMMPATAQMTSWQLPTKTRAQRREEPTKKLSGLSRILSQSEKRSVYHFFINTLKVQLLFLLKTKI